MRVFNVQVILGLVLSTVAARPASAQAPYRNTNSDPQRALADPARAQSAPRGATAFPNYPGGDRLFGPDERAVGPDGRLVDGRIVPPAPLEAPLDPLHYIVDKGDVLQARIWGEQNFDIPLPVDPDGRLFVPRVGYVNAHGRTLADVSAEVLKAIQGHFPRLHTAVTLAMPRTFLVRVTGSVSNPGGSVSANAWTRASEVITRAGGIAQGGTSRNIELHHADGTVARIDLLRYPLFGDRAFDPVVLDGDWLHIPIATRSVTINGAVNRPGTYELLKGTFAELMELTGGLTPEANDRYGLRIATVDGDERKMHLVEFQHDKPGAVAVELHHHDIINVPTVDDGARIVIKGALGTSADYNGMKTDPRVADAVAPAREVTVALPFVAGETIRGAIQKAGGLAPWADLSNAWIQHTALDVKVSGRDARRSEANPDEDGERVPVDLRSLFSGKGDNDKDMKLQPGDTIYVPSGRVDVVVSGHVMKPGIYGYSMRLTAGDYISLAGGETRDGSRSRAKVVGLDGKTRSLSDTTRVQPGDSIVVPGKVLTTAEWVTISLGVISVGLSAALLGYNLNHR